MYFVCPGKFDTKKRNCVLADKAAINAFCLSFNISLPYNRNLVLLKHLNVSSSIVTVIKLLHSVQQTTKKSFLRFELSKRLTSGLTFITLAN